MKNSDDGDGCFDSALVGLMIVFALLALGVTSVLAFDKIDTLKREAIDHGYAQHNPVTGDFEWIENPCGEGTE